VPVRTVVSRCAPSVGLCSEIRLNHGVPQVLEPAPVSIASLAVQHLAAAALHGQAVVRCGAGPSPVLSNGGEVEGQNLMTRPRQEDRQIP
jgi:hypothetical protein